MDIAWHQQCLTNALANNEREVRNLVSRYRQVMRDKADNDVRAFQIQEAIRQGKTEYDSQKFQKKARQRIMEEAEQRITAAVQNGKLEL
jgi:hypothetical protein